MAAVDFVVWCERFYCCGWGELSSFSSSPWNDVLFYHGKISLLNVYISSGSSGAIALNSSSAFGLDVDFAHRHSPQKPLDHAESQI